MFIGVGAGKARSDRFEVGLQKGHSRENEGGSTACASAVVCSLARSGATILSSHLGTHGCEDHAIRQRNVANLNG